MININQFISKYVIDRDSSLFHQDIIDNYGKITELVSGKRVLVIGGAGTIGSSYIRSILPFKPSQLCVVDINENGLTELTRDLRSTYNLFVPENYKTYPISYSDPIFEKIFFNNKGFDIVANFSALKHVRSEKDRWSVQAILENNVLRASKLLDIFVKIPPEHFFCVSTDKAANPVNIMGASKRIMEDMIMTYSSDFKITTARFANVAFSNGSLPAGFLERIQKNQPLSAPYDVKRYFVSPDESGQICMLACLLGENRNIFFPKLSEDSMISFKSIGDMLLKELGYTPKEFSSEFEAKEYASKRLESSKEYPVHYFKSDTSGEKSFEEFYVEGEHINLSKYVSMGVIDNVPPKDKDEFMVFSENLSSVLSDSNSSKEDIVITIKKYLHNFKHIETGRNLDQKM